MSKSRKARIRQEREIRDGLDMGVALSLEAGRTEIDPRAFVPLDPDSPRSAVYPQPRAKRVWAPDTLSQGRSPALKPHHREAAARLEEDWLIGVRGVGSTPGAGDGARIAAWNRTHWQELRYIRRLAYERAMGKLPQETRGLVSWTVLQVTPSARPATVSAWAEAQNPKWHIQRAVGVLLTALGMLADHYGMAPPERQQKSPAGLSQRGSS